MSDIAALKQEKQDLIDKMLDMQKQFIDIEHDRGLGAEHEVDAVVRGCQNDRILIRHQIIGVHEIKLLVASQTLEQPGRLSGFDTVPPDMGNRQIDVKAFDQAGQNAQSWLTGSFLATVEQGLHAQADAQKRPAGFQESLQGFNVIFLV